MKGSFMTSLNRTLISSLFGLSLLAFSANAHAENYRFDKNHAELRFSFDHLGLSQQSGEFTKFDGILDFNAQSPEKSTLNVTIKTDSLATLVPAFDNHLKSKDFFDVENFPEAKFVSTDIDITGKDTGIITGDLTLHGHTESIQLTTKLNFQGEHPASKFNPKFKDAKALGFSATGKIKRSDFGLEKYAPAVSDEVILTIEVDMVNN